MRAKIIADIAVVIGFARLFIWWLNTIPLQKLPYEQTLSQALAIVFTLLWVTISLAVAMIYIFKWIHNK